MQIEDLQSKWYKFLAYPIGVCVQLVQIFANLIPFCKDWVKGMDYAKFCTGTNGLPLYPVRVKGIIFANLYN